MKGAALSRSSRGGSHLLAPDLVLLPNIARLGETLDILGDSHDPKGPLSESESVALKRKEQLSLE